MKYLLDTNVCIFVIKRKPPAVLHRFEQCLPGDLVTGNVSEFSRVPGLGVENWTMP